MSQHELVQQSSWAPSLKFEKRKFIRNKEVIFREKEDSTKGFYFLKAGLIKISTLTHSGEELIIDIVCDETPFGEQVVDGEKYFSTATAMIDSIVYFFPISTVESLIVGDGHFRTLLYQSVTEKLEILSNNLLYDSLPSEKLLARTILKLREKFISDQFPFTQTELCRYTNLNRNTIYHIFKKWTNDVVSIDKRKITIHNIDTLKKIASS